MGRSRPPIIPRLAGAQHDGARGLAWGAHRAGGLPRARLPQQRGGARRGDRASVDRKGRLWTAAAAGRREFGCTRRRSAKAALDCCPSYSGGRLRRLPGACGCAEYCSRVYLTRRRNRPKNPFFQEVLSRAAPESWCCSTLADWRASRGGIPATLRLVSKTSTRAAAAGPKPNSAFAAIETKRAVRPRLTHTLKHSLAARENNARAQSETQGEERQ